ncbi:TIGR00725 family protein [bacterium]|nr:TIGR00725 family protein [bacterium]
MRKFIGVIGASQPPAELLPVAEKVGEEIGKRGGVLICGGMGGIMESACKGAKRRGGVTVGILPTLTRDSANPYIDIPIVTGIGYARNMIVVLSSEAIIAIGGAFGTLTELAFALHFNIPVVGIRTWRVESEFTEVKGISYVDEPEEAVRIAMEVEI